MKEETGNLWDWRGTADALAITTNGTNKADGSAVMGRGVAAEAKKLYPGLDEYLGMMLEDFGNHATILMTSIDSGKRWVLVTFPVKHRWQESADIDLVKRSASELVSLADQEKWGLVALVRPGCGNGNLDWKIVKAKLEPILDDRFVIVEKS